MIPNFHVYAENGELLHQSAEKLLSWYQARDKLWLKGQLYMVTKCAYSFGEVTITVRRI